MNACDYCWDYSPKGSKLYFTVSSNTRIAKGAIPKDVIKNIQQREGGKDKPVRPPDQRCRTNAVPTDNPGDYYYVDGKTSRAYYFVPIQSDTRATPVRVAKNNIPPGVLPFIQTGPEFYQKFYAEREKLKPGSAHASLLEYGIQDRKSWKLWLLRNHPDKGGDTEEAAKVVAAGRAAGY